MCWCPIAYRLIPSLSSNIFRLEFFYEFINKNHDSSHFSIFIIALSNMKQDAQILGIVLWDVSELCTPKYRIIKNFIMNKCVQILYILQN